MIKMCNRIAETHSIIHAQTIGILLDCLSAFNVQDETDLSALLQTSYLCCRAEPSIFQNRVRLLALTIKREDKFKGILVISGCWNFRLVNKESM